MSITPESVQELLASEDFGQRLRAVNQLRQLEPAIAFDLLRTAIDDTSARVRYAAVSQLASVGNQNPDAALSVLRDRLLHDSEADVQAAAADSLGALKLTAAFDDLEALYRRTDEWLIKFSIVAALGELGDPRAFELLEDALQSDNELVKTAAVGALGELGDSRAIPLLLPLATHADWQIRYRLVQALGQFADPQAQAVLKTLSEDEMQAVAEEAKLHLAGA